MKTNVNNDTSSTTNSQEEKDVEAKDSDKDIPKKSKLKTVVEKTNKKIFKFNDNQGKVSKVATTVSKGGEKLSKAGRSIVKTSRELNKAMSENGSGWEDIPDTYDWWIKDYSIIRRAAKEAA